MISAADQQRTAMNSYLLLTEVIGEIGNHDLVL